jgi:hypothetical protein
MTAQESEVGEEAVRFEGRLALWWGRQWVVLGVFREYNPTQIRGLTDYVGKGNLDPSLSGSRAELELEGLQRLR